MATISFGTEDEKIGLGFELFNIMNKEELSSEDFWECYESLMKNWSLVLGEKVQLEKKIVQEIFSQLDKKGKGIINKQNYIDALKEDPYLFNWFNFFSNLEEHFRKNAKLSEPSEKHLGIELELIKAIKSFKEIGDKIKTIIKKIDPNFIQKAKENSNILKSSVEPHKIYSLISPIRAPKTGLAQPISQKVSGFYEEKAKEVTKFEDSDKIPLKQLKQNTENENSLVPFALPSPAQKYEIQINGNNIDINNKSAEFGKPLEEVPEVLNSDLRSSILPNAKKQDNNNNPQQPNNNSHSNKSTPPSSLEYPKKPFPTVFSFMQPAINSEYIPNPPKNILNSPIKSSNYIEQKRLATESDNDSDSNNCSEIIEELAEVLPNDADSENVPKLIKLESSTTGKGEVGELLKRNPLARAIWYAPTTPRLGPMRHSENQKEMPIKEISDDLIRSEETEKINSACEATGYYPKTKRQLIIETSQTPQIHMTETNNLRKRSSSKDFANILKNNGIDPNYILNELSELLEMTKDRAECLSKYMNEISSLNKQPEETVINEKISHVKQNVPKTRFTKNKVLTKMESRSGNLVMYAHNNFALVANMMIGIKKAVDSVVEAPGVRSEDYQIISKFYIVPWAVLNDQENTTKFKNCKFIDYAPQVFYNIRRIYKIKPQEYTYALGPQQLLAAFRGDFTGFTELASTGKSGSFFYYSYDSKYILKTISEEEFKFLRRLLPAYYEHLKEHPNTLLPRFYGCHRIIFYKAGIGRSKDFRFVIMNNVFSSGVKIHERFDLKGSTVGRYTGKNADPTISKKELDLAETGKIFILENEQRKLLMQIIKEDCAFFERNSIIDYSLLVGVHKEDNTVKNQDEDHKPSIVLKDISPKINSIANVKNLSSFAGIVFFFNVW